MTKALVVCLQGICDEDLLFALPYLVQNASTEPVAQWWKNSRQEFIKIAMQLSDSKAAQWLQEISPSLETAHKRIIERLARLNMQLGQLAVSTCVQPALAGHEEAGLSCLCQDVPALSAGEPVFYKGTAWKLEAEGDPWKAACWLQQNMWLTSQGDLFFSNDQLRKPLGGNIAGLHVVRAQHGIMKNAFVVHMPMNGARQATAAYFATDSAEDREGWIKSLAAFSASPSCNQNASSCDESNPLLPFQEHPKSTRVARLSNAFKEADGLNNSKEQHNLSDVDKLISQARRNSQVEYAEKGHTVLLLDWDDTLFPTTWILQDCGLHWSRKIHEQLSPSPKRELIEHLLKTLAQKLEMFITAATKLANVFIITLAKRPWVETSSHNFLPKIGELLAARGIKVIYAQENLPPEQLQHFVKDKTKSSEEIASFWTRTKADTIRRELNASHSMHGASWKNVISLGDSNFERDGTIHVCKEYMTVELDGGDVCSTGPTIEGFTKEGHLKKLRMKTVKMLEQPTIEELIAEISIFTRWLPFIVRQDKGFDIELDSTENDEQLNALHYQFTGQTERLSWTELALMTQTRRSASNQ